MNVLQSSLTPLPAFGSWSVGWFANEGSRGEVMGEISAYSDQAGTVQIYQTDDPTNPAMTVPSGDSAVIAPNTLCVLQVGVSHAYWQAVVTNGATPQTVLEATVGASQSVGVAIVLELKKLRFELQIANGLTQTADGQPTGAF